MFIVMKLLHAVRLTNVKHRSENGTEFACALLLSTPSSVYPTNHHRHSVLKTESTYKHCSEDVQPVPNATDIVPMLR